MLLMMMMMMVSLSLIPFLSLSLTQNRTMIGWLVERASVRMDLLQQTKQPKV